MGSIPAPLERDDVRSSKLAELTWSEPHQDCRLGPVVDADHLANPSVDDAYASEHGKNPREIVGRWVGVRDGRALRVWSTPKRMRSIAPGATENR